MVETIMIAVYGAFLSTTIFFWEIYKYSSDKPKIKVVASLGFITGFGSSPTEIISFEAINIGKRPVTLSNAGIALKGGKSLHFIRDAKLPKKLNESASHMIYQQRDELKNQLKDKTPIYAWFRDKTGKEYKSKKNIKKMLGL